MNNLHISADMPCTVNIICRLDKYEKHFAKK